LSSTLQDEAFTSVEVAYLRNNKYFKTNQLAKNNLYQQFFSPSEGKSPFLLHNEPT